MRAASLSRSKSGWASVKTVAKTATAANKAIRNCGLVTTSINELEHGRDPQKSKLIILRITKMPIAIQTPSAAEDDVAERASVNSSMM